MSPKSQPLPKLTLRKETLRPLPTAEAQAVQGAGLLSWLPMICAIATR